MSDKKVKISNILGSQIPDFIQADNPLFIEFLTQYYESEEREYGSTYLSDHISSLKKISTVADISLVEKQTVPAPNSTNPESPVILASLTYAYDDVINVNQTTGFPDKYGLLKIDNEIITYTGKTATSFTGCIRGFSGITGYNVGISSSLLEINRENLVFESTSAASHSYGSTITNLSVLFLQEFYKKLKRTFLPGLENNDFTSDLDIGNFVKFSRSFYQSKGIEESIKILFNERYPFINNDEYNKIFAIKYIFCLEDEESLTYNGREAKKYTIIDYDLEVLKEQKGFFSSANVIGENSGLLSQLSNKDREVPTGECIKHIIKKSLSDKLTIRTNIDAETGEEITPFFESGLSKIFYSSPADSTAYNDLMYILQRHVSSNTKNDFSFLKKENYTGEYVLQGAFDIFKAAYNPETGKTGARFLENFTITGASRESNSVIEKEQKKLVYIIKNLETVGFT